MSTADEQKRASALKALEYVEDGMIVGVGTGSTVKHFIDGLAAWKDRIEAAVQKVLAQGLRTPDIYSEGTTRVGTAQMGDAVVQALA